MQALSRLTRPSWGLHSPEMPNTALETVRRWLAIVLLIGLIGTEAELLLLKHFDGFWQLVPVTAIGVATVILAWYAVGTSRASIRAVNL